jgi:hypothetical protein
MIGFLAICLAFVAIWVIAIRKGSGLGGWACAIFFGLGAAIFLLQLVPGASYLRLTSEGFVVCSLFRKTPVIRWSEVSDFRVAAVSGRKMVVYDWYAKPQRGVRTLNRALVGATDGLPDTYGMKAQELADFLNAKRLAAMPPG